MSTLKQVQELANNLLETKFEIKTITGSIEILSAEEIGYNFRFDKAKRRFGCCRYVAKEITLSKYLVEANPHQVGKKIKDTILHELAHAFCIEIYGRREGRGHDYKWVSIAKQIGSEGRRCWSTKDFGGVNKAQSKYTGVCPSCGTKSHYHRKPKLRRSCSKCYPSRFNSEYEIEITQNY